MAVALCVDDPAGTIIAEIRTILRISIKLLVIVHLIYRSPAIPRGDLRRPREPRHEIRGYRLGANHGGSEIRFKDFLEW